jgi:Ca2+/Na+ antiporter
MAKHKEKGKSSTPIIITGLVMILLFCVFVIFLVSQGHSIPDVDELKAQTRLKNLADLNVENQKVLTQYRWIDKNKGVVGIPIDRAMDLVLVQLQSAQPHPAGPVNTPAAPQPQASPAPSPNK